MGMIVKGGMTLVGKDAVKLMQMLIDLEFRLFKGLDVKVLFLQNIIVDLLLGYEVKDVFVEYCEYVRKKYCVLPGFITQNLPHMLTKLREWGIENAVVCSSVNKIGYLMSPSVATYVEAINATMPTSIS